MSNPLEHYHEINLSDPGGIGVIPISGVRVQGLIAGPGREAEFLANEEFHDSGAASAGELHDSGAAADLGDFTAQEQRAVYALVLQAQEECLESLRHVNAAQSPAMDAELRASLQFWGKLLEKIRNNL